MIVRCSSPAQVAPLIGNWRETMLWSFLAGRMGEAFVSDADAPRAALICVADFCFLAGEPDEALAAFVPQARAGAPFVIVMPQNARWAWTVERVCPQAKRLTRYAFQKRDTFDRAALARMAVAPPGFALCPMDERLYHAAQAEGWSRDLVSQYPDFAAYAAHGRGVCATENGVPVCGASSYTDWPGGIEIEVDCRDDHRRKGLARACAAALMLDCLQDGLHPSWDAANEVSAHLADTLGYEPAGAYPALELTL